jgi:glutaconate CoA-transferase subunit A
MAEIVSLADGVAAVVHDGDTMAMGGFTHLIPLPPATRSSATAGAS